MESISVGISAIAYALPPQTVDLRTLDARGLLESPVDVLTEFGFQYVHISDRPADELALLALRRLVDEHVIDPETVSALFYAGAIPESHRVADGRSALEGFTYPVAR